MVMPVGPMIGALGTGAGGGGNAALSGLAPIILQALLGQMGGQQQAAPPMPQGVSPGPRAPSPAGFKATVPTAPLAQRASQQPPAMGEVIANALGGAGGGGPAMTGAPAGGAQLPGPRRGMPMRNPSRPPGSSPMGGAAPIDWNMIQQIVQAGRMR